MRKNKLFIWFTAITICLSLSVATVTVPVFADEDMSFVDFDMPDIGQGVIVGPGGENPTPFIDPVPAPTPDPEPVNPCASGHTLDAGTVTQLPTCTDAGQTMYRCMICNYAEVRNEPGPIGHISDGGTVVQNATCAQEGIIAYKCLNCGADMGTDVFPKTDHISDEGNIVSLATCTKPGLVEYRCIYCGASLGTVEVPMIDHISDNGTVVKLPTATEPGKIEYRCLNCNTVLREEIIPSVKKRDTPKAVFDTATCVLSNIPVSSVVAVNGNVISDNASGVLSLLHMFPLTGTNKITVKANATETEAESDEQVISIQKRSAPSNLSSVDEPANGGCGYINGVSTEMEYALADSSNFTMCTSHSMPVSAGIYIVRYKATANSVASDCIEILVKKAKAVKPATPTATLNGAHHIIENVEHGILYSVNNGVTWAAIPSISIQLNDNDMIHAVKTGYILLKRVVDGVESDIQVLPVVRNVAPKGVKTHWTDGHSGKITGVDATMQYKKSSSSKWIDIYSTQIDGLVAGNYDIRRKGINSFIESLAITVTVEKESHEKQNAPNAKFDGYSLCIKDCEGCMISFDGQKTWTSVITANNYYVNENVINPAYGICLFKPSTDTKLQSDVQYIAISKQVAPSGLGSVAATPSVLGKIVGVDASMQCRSALQNAWTDITGNEVVLPAGIYYVRRKGANQCIPSDAVQVTVNVAADGTPASSSTEIVKDTSSSSSSSSSTGIVVERASSSEKKEEQKIIVERKDTKDTEKEESKEEKTSTTETVDEAKKESVIVAEELLAETVESEAEVDIVKEEAATLTGEKGWVSIEATFEAATKPVVVELNLQTEVPAEVFEKAAETNTSLVLEANKEAVWSIEPADINVGAVVNSVDMGIKNDSDVIPKQVIEDVDNNSADHKVDRTFDIKHEGDFGFKANLTIKAKEPSQGKYANLYWYKPDTGKLTFVDFAKVNEKNEATFTMSHASSYAVIISNAIMSDKSLEEASSEAIVSSDNQNVNESSDTVVNNTVKNNTTSVATIIFIILAILLLAVITGIGIAIYTKISR